MALITVLCTNIKCSNNYKKKFEILIKIIELYLLQQIEYLNENKGIQRRLSKSITCKK